MVETLAPETPEQLEEALKWAVAGKHSFELYSGGTKRTLGRPAGASHALDLSSFRDIASYVPEELVLTTGAATLLSDIEAALFQHRQQLAFEPPDLGPLLGKKVEAGTLGGAIACNHAGPRRLTAGAARDHFLGFEGVSGRGERFKAGGKVVKNVTGYDLSKLLAGSWGTLAAMTEVSVKVLPVPERTRTVLVYGCDPSQALKAMTLTLQGPFDVSGAAYLPVPAAERTTVGYVSQAGETVTALRLEGPGASVTYRCEKLRGLLVDFGEVEELHSTNSRKLWSEIRDVMPFASEGDDRAVWKISVPPSAGADVTARLSDSTGGEVFLDWGGGLVWLALEEGQDAMAPAVRQALGECGGHATLVRASETVRAAVPVFQEPAWKGLAHRIKDAFDPAGILNPGRIDPEY